MRGKRKSVATSTDFSLKIESITMRLYPELIVANGSICIKDEFIGSQRLGFLQFGGQEEADSSQKLQPGFPDRIHA